MDRVRYLVKELKEKQVTFPVILELDGSSTHLDLQFLKLCQANQM